MTTRCLKVRVNVGIQTIAYNFLSAMFHCEQHNKQWKNWVRLFFKFSFLILSDFSKKVTFQWRWLIEKICWKFLSQFCKAWLPVNLNKLERLLSINCLRPTWLRSPTKSLYHFLNLCLLYFVSCFVTKDQGSWGRILNTLFSS